MMYANRIHMTANNIQFTRIEIRIAKYLFKHYKDRYNARQLARTLDLNHAHVNKLCNLLANKRLLAKEAIGNSAYFSYDYSDRLAIKFMEYLLSLEDKESPSWLTVLLHTLKKFDGHIKMGLVFGSSIRTRDFNDMDILLMYDRNKSKAIKKIKDEIRNSELVGKPIRYVEITEKDAALNKGDKIFYNMLSDNLVFYNPEKYAEVIKKCRK